MTPVTVMIVDDQVPFRLAARAVVARIAEFEVVAEVASGEDAVLRATELSPQLVLMDIHMGEMDGIEATRRITRAQPAVKIVLASTYAVEDLPPDARSSGAVAYLNKDELSPRVLRRIWESDVDLTWSR